jgi:hypothetical protein
LSKKDAEGKEKVKGFALTYTSIEACATDPTKKFTFVLEGRCNPKKTESVRHGVHKGEGLGH